MARRIDHDELKRKLLGRRDHASDPERQRDEEFAKRRRKKEALEFARRVKAGKPPKTKTSKRSGPVKIYSPEEVAAYEAELRARGEL